MSLEGIFAWAAASRLGAAAELGGDVLDGAVHWVLGSIARGLAMPNRRPEAMVESSLARLRSMMLEIL